VAKLYYPVRESVQSILPIVDEFVMVVAESDPDDTTRERVASIGDPKVRIVDAPWDEERLGEKVYSHLTNMALDRCSGDWCFYVQADEVVHEDDLPVIRGRCEELLDDVRVEGLLFDYLHFFGDYRHYQPGHGWYRKEIRVIRNSRGIRSVRDAQSFRHPDDRKLTVARSGARIFHYGWVRPPELMGTKLDEFWSHRGDPTVARRLPQLEGGGLDYGPLGRLPVYEGTHPAVMGGWIARMDWDDRLRLEDPPGLERALHKDERPKYRILSAIERWTGLDLNHKNYGRVLRV
jgi:hypothetical protein